MDNFLDKIFFRSRNLDYISQNLIDLTKQTTAHKIFEALNSYSDDSEVRYVGGCIRKIIKKQNVDDIDLATNLRPNEVCDALKKKQINYYETGIDHGTITAIIDDNKYEITSLRKDISTDGRHAKVEFSIDWKEDAARRDFSINSIFSGDIIGQIFTMLILTVAAAEAAIGLAIIVVYYRNRGSIRVEDIHGMKG